jgi:DNA repair photolyase
MMIREIEAKVMLAHVKQPDAWFGLKYNMNLYRGCQHQCIYCDSRSECYQIENFSDVLVKVNAIDRLRDELPRKRVKGTIGFGSMSDTYGPVEREYQLTRRALEVIAEQGFPVHLITKSDLVTRDVDVLQTINRVHAVVSFTITTADDALARKVEPGAPSPSRRYEAMAALAEAGIHVGVTLMPVLPFIEDHAENIAAIVRLAHGHGAEYVLASFGMTLRDRQRAYYYDQLDRHFPGLRVQYEGRFGGRYGCGANGAAELENLCGDLCAKYGLSQRVSRYEPGSPVRQLALF